ncbi:hypothetical protein SAY86_003671 [Trapa natans]|uniref:EF-hand domain-containing protein n=1 Tax=Trapa natans TaxID=22666 RepID=A0AAN7RF32_TRANT|nr:hypothetical protein SAY86_003671 [Trapa natans]
MRTESSSVRITISQQILTVLVLVISVAHARPLLVRDGVEQASDRNSDRAFILRLRETSASNNDTGSSGGGSECEQMYGFLPCSTSKWGHLFLILVYEYLLFHGESYLASGSKQIFKLLGPGIFGASAFHVLGALPESVILVASGLLNSKETAQEYVLTGVGLMAGSSILLLTLLWGTCNVLGRRSFSSGMEESTEASVSDQASNSLKQWIQRLLTSLTGSGVHTDLETSYTARIMIVSVIPFAIIQLEKLVPLHSEQRAVILSALVISAILLLIYFIYQIFEPWIQKRRLEFVKHERFVLTVLQFIQKRALEGLLTDDGSPNTLAIKRLFEETDHDKDDRISPSELKELLLEIKFHHMDMSNERAVEDVIREFDLDGDRTISKDEFVVGFTKWLEQGKTTIDQGQYSGSSFRDLYRVFQPFIQRKKEERELKRHLLSEMLVQMEHKSTIEGLLAEDGTPNIPSIKRLFEEMDDDGDSRISQAEVIKIMAKIKFDKAAINVDEAAVKMMEMLDASGDRHIDEEEFVSGLAKWLDSARTDEEIHTPSARTQDDSYQKAWEETDRLVEDKNEADNDKGTKVWWLWAKSVALMVIGIAIMAVLAEPLIHSVQSFSTSVSIPSFFISFILVPWATNAREVAAAVRAARQKKPRTTSLTFSEIYGGVFMSNMIGLCVLLCLVYGRDLTWEFSAEVLVVLIVTAALGAIASFRSTFPLWTAVLAYLLYPLSLLSVYILDDLLNYS